MINLLGIFSKFTDKVSKTFWTIVGIALIVFLIYACIKYENGKWFLLSFLGIALIAITGYCGIQLNYYYTETGGIYGKIVSLYNPNQVTITNSVSYSFKNLVLTQESGNIYSAKITSDEVLDLVLDETATYGVYINNMPCNYVEIADDYVIAKYRYIFYDDNFNKLMDDTLTLKFAFYTNSTYLSVTTDGGADAVKYWNYYFNKNVFEVSIDNKGYTYSQDISFGSGDISEYSTVTYYINNNLYLKQVYKNGSIINLPDVECSWKLDNVNIDENFIVTDNLAIYGELGYNVICTYIEETSTYSVTGVENKTDTSIVIPTLYYDGVHGFADVTAIGNYAFQDYANLTDITIPTSITTIGNYAFEGCTNMTDISIPDNITSIGKGAFKNCTKFTKFKVTENSQLTSIEEEAFYNCTSLASVNIPYGVKTLADYIFYGCTSLTNVTLNSDLGIKKHDLNTIGNYAFYNCTSLPTYFAGYTTPFWNVSSIGDYAFSNTGIETFFIEDNIKYIGVGAFENCAKLTQLYVYPSAPPVLASTTSIPDTIYIIRVNKSAIEIYKIEENWSYFANKIQGIS